MSQWKGETKVKQSVKQSYGEKGMDAYLSQLSESLRFRSDVLFQASSLLGGRRHRRAAAACTVDRLRPLV